MSESGDWCPADYGGGYDFNDARAHYADHSKRSYSDAQMRGTRASDLVPKRITTQSDTPLVIVCDVTGSMGEWPATMFSKLPYMDHETRTEYLGPGTEISWAAVGDAQCGDNYPLQVRPFSSEAALAEELKRLVIEGGGKGDESESYELGALYLARNADMPRAKRKPICIFIGDETPHQSVSVEWARHAHVTLQASITTTEIFEELKRKFAVYYIRKPYGTASVQRMDSTNRRMRDRWVELLGEDHVADLGDPTRVVDVIFGILAKEADRVDYFREELEGRQRPEQVATVYESLKTIHRKNGGTAKKSRTAGSGKSRLHTEDGDEGDDTGRLD